MKKAIPILILTIFTWGCTVGPNYHRPKIDVPTAYRGPSTAPGESSGQSFGDQKWWEVFQDPQLQELIRTALKQNYDVQIAAARILEAQAQLGITRADQLPAIGAGAARGKRALCAAKAAARVSKQTRLGAAPRSPGNWISGASTAAPRKQRGRICWRQSGRAAQSMNTLVSDVAAAYFQLRAYDLQLEISRRTLASRQDSLKLTQTLPAGGATNMLDVRQAEQLVAVAAENIPDLERRHPATGELHQHPSGKQSRSRCAWNEADRAAALARGPGGNPLPFTGAAARYPRSRSAVDGGQR